MSSSKNRRNYNKFYSQSTERNREQPCRKYKFNIIAILLGVMTTIYLTVPTQRIPSYVTGNGKEDYSVTADDSVTGNGKEDYSATTDESLSKMQDLNFEGNVSDAPEAALKSKPEAKPGPPMVISSESSEKTGGVSKENKAFEDWLCARSDSLQFQFPPKQWSDWQVRSLARILERNCDFETRNSKHKRVALFKNHKTGGTTIQSILTRFGVNNNARFVASKFEPGANFWSSAMCPSKVKILKSPRNESCFDMSLRHVFHAKYWYTHKNTTKCSQAGRWIEDWMKLNEKLIGPDVATIIPTREPKSHLRSAIGYYRIKGNIESRTEKWNPLSLDFRMFNKEQIEYFLNHTLGLGSGEHYFKTEDYTGAAGIHILVLERLYESLAVMRRRLGWSIVDVLYKTVTHKGDKSTLEEQKGEQEKKRKFMSKSYENVLGLDFILNKGLNDKFEQILKAFKKDEIIQESKALGRLSAALGSICNPMEATTLTQTGPNNTVNKLCKELLRWSIRGHTAMERIAGISKERVYKCLNIPTVPGKGH